MAGAGLGAISNYWLNYRFSFDSNRRHREAMPRFLAMAAVGVMLNGVFVQVLMQLQLHFFIAQVFATLCILCLNFLVSRRWIFASRK